MGVINAQKYSFADTECSSGLVHIVQCKKGTRLIGQTDETFLAVDKN